MKHDHLAPRRTFLKQSIAATAGLYGLAQFGGSADAAGARAVVVGAGSTDPYNPKVVRATAGSIFRVPVVAGGAPDAVAGLLADRGYRIVGAVAGDGRSSDEADLDPPLALVLGSETHGLPPGFAERLDDRVTVPMAPGVDSLNVAMAGTVLCFEVRRRHRP